MSLSTHALKEQRASKQDEMKTLMSKAEISSEDRTRFDALEAEVRGINADIRRASILEEAERHEHADPVDGGGHDLRDLERRFSVGKAISEHQAGRLSGVEAEYASEFRSGRKEAISMPVSAFLGERRALQATNDGPSGGYLVGTTIGPLADRFRPALKVESMGATVLTGLTSWLDLPNLNASGSASWVNENQAATGTAASFEMLSMGPRTVTAQYEITRRMMLQATQIDSILRSDIGWLLTAALDAAAINGSGSISPLGILNTSGISTIALGTNGAVLDLDVSANMIGAVADAGAQGATGFLTNSRVRKMAKKLKDSEGRLHGIPTIFRNERVEFSNQVPYDLTKGSGTALSAILYGLWSDLVIGYWSSVDIVINPYADSVASKGGELIHAFLDADSAVRRPEAFAVCKDVVTT